jgi:RNA polymerase sigma factor (TIGR02999 family)
VNRSATADLRRGSSVPARSAASEQLTNLLRAWTDGNPQAAEKLFRAVYGELRRLAVRRLRGERSDHTLRPTALVHEAFLRLVDQREVVWQNRMQFFALAGQAMRRVLLDHARARATEKRAGGCQRVTLNEDAVVANTREPDAIEIDAALEELSAIDPAKVELVELRFFGGLSVDEAAEVLGISPSTAARQWRLARAWLYQRLQESEDCKQ